MKIQQILPMWPGFTDRDYKDFYCFAWQILKTDGTNLSHVLARQLHRFARMQTTVEHRLSRYVLFFEFFGKTNLIDS
jgi:hypothetical protein